MEVFGELKNAYLEKDNAGKTALGAICCGDNVTSEVDPLLTATPKVLIGNGAAPTRLATTPELISIDNRLVATSGRVTALEQRAVAGAGSVITSLLPVLSGVTFSNCMEENIEAYRVLKLKSSIATSSSITYTGTLAHMLGHGSVPWDSPYPKKVSVLGVVGFKCQSLAWWTDAMQSLCYAAPYTDVSLSMGAIDIDNALFFEKPNLNQPRLDGFGDFANNGAGARISLGLSLSGTSVVFHRDNSGDVDPSVVEFVFQGLSYKMLYTTYLTSVATIPINITATFTHHYYGDRDTYAFIYPNYRYFEVGRRSTVLEL